MKTRHVLMTVLTLGVSLCLTDLAEAQRGGGRRGGTRGQNLTEEQKAAMQERRAQRQEGLTEEQKAEMEKKRAERMEAMYAELGLTEEQKAAMQKLQQDQQDQMQALRENREEGERPSREEMQEMRAKHQAELAKTLDEEQLKTYQELMARPERGQNEGRQGQRSGRGQRGGEAENQE